MRHTSRKGAGIRDRLALSVGTLFAVLLSGCGKEYDAPAKSDEIKHIERAQRLVIQTISKANPQNPVTPASLDELKKLAKTKLTADDLREMGIDDLDKALTSPRDNMAYVLVPGINIRNAMSPAGARQRGGKPEAGATMSSGPPIILYEQKGSGGRHLVAFTVSGATEWEESRLKEHVPSFKP